MGKAFQVDKLLGFMQEEPDREWMASDFQHSPRFIGYEAGPRLCDLCNMGLVCRVGKQGRFVLFALTEKGRKAWSVDDRYKLQEKAPKTNEEPSETDEIPEQESPATEEQLDGDTSVGDLAGEEYPKSESTSLEHYKDGFIVTWKRDFVNTGGIRAGKNTRYATGKIILALYRRFNVSPDWHLIV